MSDVSRHDNRRPSVSIIIPTLNDPLIGSVLERVLLEAATVPSEVIVVGRDISHQIPRGLPLRFEDTRRPVGASVARNIGISVARGRTLVFLDADCFVRPGWLRALLAPLDSGELVIGGGVVTSTTDYWMLVYNLSMFHEYLASNPAGVKPYLPTLNLAVAREVIDQVGLFDETLLRSQDIDWTVRMAMKGYRLVFEPKAAVEHRPQKTGMRPTWVTWYRTGYFNVRNRVRYATYYRTPTLMRSASLLLGLSPLIGLYTTVSIFAHHPQLLKYAHAAPPVYLAKIAWCLGAARALRNKQAPGERSHGR